MLYRLYTFFDRSLIYFILYIHFSIRTLYSYTPYLIYIFRSEMYLLYRLFIQLPTFIFDLNVWKAYKSRHKLTGNHNFLNLKAKTFRAPSARSLFIMLWVPSLQATGWIHSCISVNCMA